MTNCFVMVISVDQRSRGAVKIQEILTKYGCLINTRLGLHETGDSCTEKGLIILQLSGTDAETDELKNELNAIDGIKAQKITI